MAYIKKGGQGGKRPNAGRPRKLEANRKPAIETEQKIKERLPDLIDAMIASALGTDGQRGDFKAQQYLLERVMGKPSQVTFSGDTTPWLKLRYTVFQRDDFKCRYCGKSPNIQGVVLEADHVLPRSKGGKDELQNLVTACRECNSGKSDVLLEGRQLKKLSNIVTMGISQPD